MAKNKWAITISNFCSDEIIIDHIESYLENSPLSKKRHLKNKINKTLYLTEKESDAEKYAFSENSQFIGYKYNFYKIKNLTAWCFGNNINNLQEAAKSVLLYALNKATNTFQI